MFIYCRQANHTLRTDRHELFSLNFNKHPQKKHEVSLINYTKSRPTISGLTLVYGDLYWAQTNEIILCWRFCISVTMPDFVHVCSVAVDMERMVRHDSALRVKNGKEN